MDLKPIQQKGIHMWYCKPSQLSLASETMVPRWAPITSTFLNQYNSLLQSKHWCLNPQVSVPFTPHQRSFLLQQKGVIIESHIWSRCREQLTVRCLILLTHSLHNPMITQHKPMAQECHRRGSRNIIKARGPEHLLQDCVLYMTVTLHPKKSQHCCLHKIWKRKMPDIRPTWMVELSQNLTPRQRTAGNECWERGFNFFPRDKTHIWLSNTKWSSI